MTSRHKSQLNEFTQADTSNRDVVKNRLLTAYSLPRHYSYHTHDLLLL